jgi:UDP-glucose 4-epimerase
MRILVLGGDGFIGSHFVDKAISQRHQLTVFDRFHNDVSMNLEHHRGKVKCIAGEFANRQQLQKALQGQDIVYHFICATDPISSWDDPFIEIEGNLKYSVQLFELAAACGVKKIVFPSSGGTIYGPQGDFITERTLPAPFSPYGITKLATEHFLHYFQKCTGIATDIYRIGNAYGPRQPMDRPQGVIAVWMGRILRETNIEIYGSHDTLRDYIYVEDIAHLLTHSLRDLSSSDTYNMGTGKGVSPFDLLEIYCRVIDMPFTYKVLPRRKSDNTFVILDSSKLISFFPGFKFQDMEEKIKYTWLCVKKNYYSMKSKDNLISNRK